MRFTMERGCGSSGGMSDITDGVQGVDLNGDLHGVNGAAHGGPEQGSEEVLDNGAAAAAIVSNHAVIVTNVPEEIFDNQLLKREFESLFTHIDPSATCHYLKSFRRVRISLSNQTYAAEARVCLHDTEICGHRVKCFYAQPIVLRSGHSSPHLHPPALEKQFLISPPASPPVGWEPVHEGEPVINYDLLAAMASLAPGEAHELHPPSHEQPGIVVHICEDPSGYGNMSIEQTRRPPAR